MKAEPGRCRYCGCTEDNPCSTPPSGEPCAWFDGERTVCTNSVCVAQHHIDYERNIAKAIDQDRATRRYYAEQRRVRRRKKKAA